MIKIQEKQDCCGCYACENVCPKHSIMLQKDEEGFLYPQINLETCIDCHLCEKICPIINVEPEKKKPQTAHLIQITDDVIRKESTSGGAFTAIAKWILRQGGVVFGATLDINTFEVHHRWVDNEADLSLFRNSKYVQSHIDKCYQEVKEFLKEDRWVCFSGTPCQIEGLYHFLRGAYDKLLLVDVVCYGIPSPGVYKDYMQWKQQQIGGNFQKMLFREKRLSYNYTSFSIFNDKPELNYHQGVEREQFMRSFFSDMNVRPSCYNCKFKKRYRVSDFTIWDCYDVKAFSKNFDEDGTNRVLVHSALGEKILRGIKEWTKEEPYEDIDMFIKDEIAMVKSVVMNPKREAFFADYATMSMGDLMEKWFPLTLTVRIKTFLRMAAFKLGIYNEAKRTVKKLLRKN
ncbi:Coenzyme F420-reducing hydrogenase, beta subunit [Prevotella sp. ne3005]|uniref:Coenzyme F420 hydrogenase/dehydrogenase, beta subunit C-terminal domain n=1 Tax=Prevotella sp. ne3005 TaxID=1761887 RepID=UPI0008CEB84C|nr:Coenzyme F420 hydrogenase/dehydrogenase, beta subunit C-terminal domain [Prevotella sp. ne3005]SEM53929.1 Coenzyme F420-reducing hydrogenase, beta subunit [Prevotella sp. ne3005]